MSSAPLTYRRGGAYWFRRRFPAQLVSILGQAELRFSLRTNIQKEARQRALRLAALLTEVFERATMNPSITRDQIEILVRDVVQSVLETAERERVSLTFGLSDSELAARAAAYDEHARKLYEARRRNDLLFAAEPALRAAKERGIAFDPEKDANARIALSRCQIKQAEVAERLAAEERGTQRPVSGFAHFAAIDDALMAEAAGSPPAVPLFKSQATAHATASPGFPDQRNNVVAFPPLRETTPQKAMVNEALWTPAVNLTAAQQEQATYRGEATSDPTATSAAPTSGRAHGPWQTPGLEFGNGEARRLLTMKFADAYREFHKATTLRKNGKYSHDMLRSLRLFLEFMGAPTAGDITPSQAEQFKSVLQRLPHSWGKCHYKGRTAKEAIEIADRLEKEQVGRVDGNDPERDIRVAEAKVRRLHLKTINKHIDSLGKFFKWVDKKDRDARVKNPFSDIRFCNKELDKLPQDERQAYNLVQVAHIFSSPCWAGSRSAWYRKTPGDVISKDARYWAPLIAETTGMRQEEICQLHIDDIAVDEAGIDHFQVRRGVGKSLKTETSERDVPIPTLVLDLGFLEYVQSQKASHARRVFPDLEPDAVYGRKGASISKWYGRYRKAIGISEEKLDFQSFRHTFITQALRQGIDLLMVSEICGQKSDLLAKNYSTALSSQTAKRYFKGHFLEAKKKAIDSIDWGFRVERINGEPQLIVKAR